MKCGILLQALPNDFFWNFSDHPKTTYHPRLIWQDRAATAMQNLNNSITVPRHKTTARKFVVDIVGQRI